MHRTFLKHTVLSASSSPPSVLSASSPSPSIYPVRHLLIRKLSSAHYSDCLISSPASVMSQCLPLITLYLAHVFSS